MVGTPGRVFDMIGKRHLRIEDLPVHFIIDFILVLNIEYINLFEWAVSEYSPQGPFSQPRFRNIDPRPLFFFSPRVCPTKNIRGSRTCSSSCWTRRAAGRTSARRARSPRSSSEAKQVGPPQNGCRTNNYLVWSKPCEVRTHFGIILKVMLRPPTSVPLVLVKAKQTRDPHCQHPDSGGLRTFWIARAPAQ